MGSKKGPPDSAIDDKTPQYINFQPGTYDKVLRLIPPERSTRVLDVGAGQGYFCRKLKDLNYNVEACDILPDQFRCPDIPFIPADLTKPLQIEDNQYDCVVSIEVIEHMENHLHFMRELVRITKPNGLIIVTTPNVLSIPSRWHLFLYGYSDCAPYPLDPTREDYFLEHINPISVPEIIFCLERCGADLEMLTTNRLRRSSWVFMPILYPIMAAAIRWKFFHSKHSDIHLHGLYRRHVRWVLSQANLMGRVTIAVGRKRAASGQP
jgi:SAM-dependent methyltransferase